MIGLLLIAQLGAAQLSADVAGASAMDLLKAPQASNAETFRALPGFPGALARVQRGGRCPVAGQMEASAREPTALYRKGDRPAKGFRSWASYPEPQLCLTGDTP